MRNIYLGIIASILFTIASIYITFPLIFHMTDFVNGELVIAWIMNWNIHALTHGIWPFFNANIFYPYTNTLAYSDLFLSSSIIALPFFIFFHEPILPSNITFLSSLILLGFFTYLLTIYLTKNFFASLVAGLLIIFSPVVLDKRYHLQILAIEWIPLSLLFFLQFLKKNQYRFLIYSLFCFVIQSYNSFMAGYFLLFSYVGIGISYVVFDRKYIRKFFTKKILFSFLLAFFLLIPIVIPYYQVSYEFHFVRDIRETIHLALQPEDLLVTNELSRFQSFLWFFDAPQYPATAEVKPGFLGGVFSVLTIISIFWTVKLFPKTKHKKRYVILFAFLGVGLFGLILSLGPALHLGRHTIHRPFLIPLPYSLAYYLIPGFKGIRDSSRFEMLFVLSLSVVVGIVLSEILQKKRKVVQIFCYFLLFAGIILEFHGPINYQKAFTFEQFPPVYTWLKNNTPSNAIILEMPVYNWDNNPFGDNREVLREYFSTLHFRKLISGGSGFSPPMWQLFAKEEFADFPSGEAIKRIKAYGTQYLIVHADEFDLLYQEKYKAGSHILYPSAYILSELSQNINVRFIIKEGDAYIYAVKQ